MKLLRKITTKVWKYQWRQLKDFEVSNKEKLPSFETTNKGNHQLLQLPNFENTNEEKYQILQLPIKAIRILQL